MENFENSCSVFFSVSGKFVLFSLLDDGNGKKKQIKLIEIVFVNSDQTGPTRPQIRMID